MRTLQTLIALLASLLIAAAANAQNQGETMNDNKQTQTLCLGRFLVDVPKDAYKLADASDYHWDSVSVTRRVSQEAFQKLILDKEKVLKETRHKTEPSLLKHISKSGDGNSVVMVFWESPKSRYIYQTEGYKWIKGFQYLVKGTADDDRAAPKAEKITRTLGELKYRRDNEIPTIPGFCIDGGFFAGEPALPHREDAFFHLLFKNNPDVRVVIRTDMNGEDIGDGILSRVDNRKFPADYADVVKRMKTLRRGPHPVNKLEADEHLETLPGSETHSIHLFEWESRGKPRDIYAPRIALTLQTGESSEYDSVPPSLTDKQAIELFDSIVNSIRLRPTGAPR